MDGRQHRREDGEECHRMNAEGGDKRDANHHDKEARISMWHEREDGACGRGDDGFPHEAQDEAACQEQRGLGARVGPCLAELDSRIAGAPDA